MLSEGSAVFSTRSVSLGFGDVKCVCDVLYECQVHQCGKKQALGPIASVLQAASQLRKRPGEIDLRDKPHALQELKVPQRHRRG